VTNADLGWKECGAGAGWDLGRFGLDVWRYGAGADRIFQISAGAGRVRTKNVNPRRTLGGIFSNTVSRAFWGSSDKARAAYLN